MPAGGVTTGRATALFSSALIFVSIDIISVFLIYTCTRYISRYEDKEILCYMFLSIQGHFNITTFKPTFYQICSCLAQHLKTQKKCGPNVAKPIKCNTVFL